MTVPRDSQFTEWSKLLWHEIKDHFGDWWESDNTNANNEAQEVIARRTYDLAMFIVKQVYRGEGGPGEILYLDGEPVSILPENLEEWFKQKEAEAYFSDFPQGFHDWVASLGWKL